MHFLTVGFSFCIGQIGESGIFLLELQICGQIVGKYKGIVSFFFKIITGNLRNGLFSLIKDKSIYH